MDIDLELFWKEGFFFHVEINEKYKNYSFSTVGSWSKHVLAIQTWSKMCIDLDFFFSKFFFTFIEAEILPKLAWTK